MADDERSGHALLVLRRPSAGHAELARVGALQRRDLALDDVPHIRLHGNVVHVDQVELVVGLPLIAVFDEVTADDTLVRWRPRRGDEAKGATT